MKYRRHVPVLWSTPITVLMSIVINCHSKMEQSQEDIKILSFIPNKEIITLVQSVFSRTVLNSFKTTVKTMMTCGATDFTSKYKPSGQEVGLS